MTSMASAMEHFLTHHSEAELIVIPVSWLPRDGRHWFLFPDVDAIALSVEAWESGKPSRIFRREVGINVRLLRLYEKPPARVRCPDCPPRQRPTMNDLELLGHH